MRFIRQRNEMRFDFGVTKSQKTDAPRKRESFRSRGSWIEQQRLTEPLCSWLMRVTKDADIGMFTFKKFAAFFRHLPPFIQNMTNGDAAACQFDHDFGRKSTLLVAIHVAGDGGDRSELLQLFDYRPIANVSGVDNVIDACEILSNHRIEEPMGVGNHSDPNGVPLVHGAAPDWDPSEACTCFQLNVNGSGNFFGKAASSVFNRSALAVLIGCVESHSIRPSSFSESRSKNRIIPEGSIFAR